MRRLLYVPIVHSAADMGSLGPALEKKSAALYGERRWAKHNETMAAFWAAIARHLQSLDPFSLKIYQDGLVSNGELGRRIVQEAADRGSLNYQAILNLLDHGAELRKTEDVRLLLEELNLTQQQAATGGGHNHAALESKKARLTEQRDNFIAMTIDDTLGAAETGLLFVGAYHNVYQRLSRDIEVQQLKDVDKVRSYYDALSSRNGDERFEQLASYLAAPVEAP